MKTLNKLVFDKALCKTEFGDFQKMLTSNKTLSESEDILPFFKTRNNLSSLISRYFLTVGECDVIAHEYPFYGDFAADLIVGDSKRHEFLLVEFEHGTSDGIFKKKPGRATSEWARRLEGAFSQILDWMWKLNEMRSTPHFVTTFGSYHAKFKGLIIIGKGADTSEEDERRLEWRNNNVVVDSNHIEIISFDRLCTDFKFWLETYY